MGYRRRHGELLGDYQHRMRDEKIAGSHRFTQSINSGLQKTNFGKPVYYTGGSNEPEETKIEGVMHKIDWGVIVIEPVATLLLLATIPGLGLINCGVTVAYLGSRLYHAAMSEQVGKPVDDFLTINWQKFQQTKK